ncbi:DoxX family protein [Pseudonocardia sp.]|jgi:putative oxidoreductase|uniref:DoxX family protein n=1 Tax=Pseudonocardia sp. TaxID=60912 RepID=UPI003D0CB54B
MPRTLPAQVRDWAENWYRDVLILVARVLVSVVMLAHVWQTFVQTGFASTTVVFANFGIPIAIAATAFTLVVELTGSLLLLFGVMVRWAAAGFVFVMSGAVWFVHAKNGIFVKDGGWELVGMIIAVVLGIAAFGPGRLSLSHVAAGWRARAEARRAERRSVVVTVHDTGRPAAPAMAGATVSATTAPAADADATTEARGFPMLSETFVPMGRPAPRPAADPAAAQHDAPRSAAGSDDREPARYVPAWTEPEPHLFSSR